MKSIIGKLWALPTTILGLIYALIGSCFGIGKVRICFAHNAICFYNHPFIKGRQIALTLGNVIMFQHNDDYFAGLNIAEHEKQHTIQAEVLGILYLPLHAICFIIYHKNVFRNPLERGPYSNPPRPW